MTTEKIVRQFLLLDDEQKKYFINQMNNKGVSAETIKAFDWLAVLGQEKLQETIFQDIYEQVENEASMNRLMSTEVE